MGYPPSALFSIRTAVIVLAALVFGLLAGALRYRSTHSLVEAVMYAAGAFGATMLLLHTVVEVPPV